MLPPYGKILKAYIDLGIIPNYSVYLYVGKDAFAEAKTYLPTQVCLCLPFDKDVTAFEWPVQGVKLLVIDTGGMIYSQLEKILAFLLNEGAKSVYLQTDLTPME